MEEERRDLSRETAPRVIAVSSPAFENGTPIPLEHTRGRADTSPAIHWSGLPGGTKSLALICDDPDAPKEEPFVHWAIYNIPPHSSPGRPPVGGLPSGVSKEIQPHEVAGAWQGLNDFGEVGYGGPAPPPGDRHHHYRFSVYALNTSVVPNPGMTRDDLVEAMSGHILGTGELVGTFGGG